MTTLSRALLALVLACGAPSLPSAAAENNYIAITGEGKAGQWPDYALVTASVRALEKTPKEAVSETTQKLLALAKDLREMGIPEDRIEFLPPDVQPLEQDVRQDNGDYRKVIAGILAMQHARITIDKVDRIGEIITVLTNEGAYIPTGVTFMIRDSGKLDARARSLAIADARKKAENYAEGAGRPLGKLLVVEEAQIGYSRLDPTLRADITGMEPTRRINLSGRLHSPSPLPLTPQPVTSTVTLYVKYALQ